MNAFEHVRVTRSGRVATITIDRPERRNALALQTVGELCAAVGQCATDDDVRVIVVTGAGDRAFASGADLGELPDAMQGPESAEAYDRNIGVLYDALSAAPVPVVARMQASAIGGGLMLALACDIRICTADTVVGVPASRLGLMLSPFEFELLVRQSGPSRAKLVMFSGRRLDAATALAWNLVDIVAPDGELDAEVDRLAEEIAVGAPLANKAAKRLIASTTDAEVARQCYREVYASADLREGLAALAQKRQPKFKGC